MTADLTLTGRSIVGPVPPEGSGETFRAVDPATGATLEPAFHVASRADLDRALKLASEAAGRYGATAGSARASLLRRIGEELRARQDAIVERGCAETGLSAERLVAELGRTVGQLERFAELVEEGSWVDARIDHGDLDRRPAAKPDVRSMLRPLGAVAVFGASNFPLAFSVAGNDTVAALAAGNPVVVKAHPAHPGTSELAGKAIAAAVVQTATPPGIFSLLFDAGIELGGALVDHPLLRAVGFTGSRGGGRALMDRAARRPEPIPVYAEMGSINPVFLAPDALTSRGATIAATLADSLVLGMGQYCTNPGLLIAPSGAALDRFLSALQQRLDAMPDGVMLTHGICRSYHAGLSRLAEHSAVQRVGGPQGSTREGPSDGQPARGAAAVFVTDAATFVSDRSLMQEVFGPATLVVGVRDLDEMVQVACALEGQLTASLFASEMELAMLGELIGELEQRVGRLLYEGVPTGVEVCSAMVHGGPYPATSDGQSSSVGTRAIRRFTRAVCYQGYPDGALPPALQDANPLGIWRLVDGAWSRG